MTTPLRPRLPLLVALCLLLLPVARAAAADPPAVEVRVDPRVELLSIVFRLAGSPEYNMPNSASPYAEAVEAHFGKFRDHTAVKRAQELRRTRGISFDAVMSLAVHLAEMDDSATPALRMPLEPRPPQLEGRWRAEDAEAFVALLADFAREADFAGFIADQRDFHEQAAAALEKVVNRQPIVPWFDGYFGTRPDARYVVIAGLLNGGGNYGVSYRSADGREEQITPVIGVWRWTSEGLPNVDGTSLGTIVHEFCHPYANGAIDRFGAELEAAGNRLFEANRAVMQRQAYGTGRTVLYESLVRACVVRYMTNHSGEAAGQRQAAEEVARGFKWTPELAALLAEYEADREQYATLDDFMPRVVAFFNEPAAEAQAAAARAPKVVAISPANGARDVDPAIAELVITFDRPMRDGSWAIVQVENGKLPDFGRPAYDAERRVLRVPMKLAPGTAYRFFLNAGRFNAFASAEGVPLEPVEVTFSTRP